MTHVICMHWPDCTSGFLFPGPRGDVVYIPNRIQIRGKHSIYTLYAVLECCLAAVAQTFYPVAHVDIPEDYTVDPNLGVALTSPVLRLRAGTELRRNTSFLFSRLLGLTKSIKSSPESLSIPQDLLSAPTYPVSQLLIAFEYVRSQARRCCPSVPPRRRRPFAGGGLEDASRLGRQGLHRRSDRVQCPPGTSHCRIAGN